MKVRMVESVVDRLGRPLKEGDRVIIDNGRAPIARVVGIKAQMDPLRPPGFLVEMMAGFTFFVPPGRPLVEGILIAEMEEEQPKEADAPGEGADGPRLVES
jgi:antitoxin (DNA-binding transcriptional repressor) of toxin-antitoxin stability system